MKKLFLLIFLLSAIPAFANDFQRAYESGSKVLVYFYSPSCISCNRFNPYFDQISKEHRELKCVRLNIDNEENLNLFKKYHGLFIPYLVLTSSKSKKAVSVNSNCAINNMCLERVLKGLKS